MRITYLKIKEFIIKHHVLVVVIVVPLGAVIFLTGLIVYNQSSYFCYSCHINQGTYHYFDKNRPVHQNVDDSIFSCINCHKDKTVQHIYANRFSKKMKSAQLIGNLQQRPVPDPKAVYTTEQCLVCHPDRLDVIEREPYLLKSDGLKKIGLRFDKKLHYRLEEFHYDDQLFYKELIQKTQLTEQENEDLEFLEKIRTGNCAQCHVQQKIKDRELYTDKQVNFIARNPISCAGCHEDATIADHPGKPLKSPTKQICQKCHHGQIHGKFSIFKADCDEQKETDHCIKCHPLYQANFENQMVKM